MDIKCLLLIACLGTCSTHSQQSIPRYLRECYENTTFHGVRLPMNLQTIIDIVRKAEKYSDTSMDMRTISSSLLHRFKFDGIEYYSGLKVKEGVLPFGGTGSQRSKHRIVEELIPGNPEAFPSEALTLTERCTLHRAISNTVWEHDAASEDRLCIEGVTEKISDRSMPGEVKVCPIEYGVVSTPYGTISLGSVIGAIAGSLQPQNVTVKLLLRTSESDQPETTKSPLRDFTTTGNFSYNEDEVDLVIPKRDMALDRSMWLSMISRSTTHIDNVWAATIAGDLAEMAVYQGPLVGNRMVLGVTGFWNSSIRPSIYYLMGKDGTFDATRAEIIGAIDGLVISKHLPSWIEKFHNLRLSQVLDIYYSNRGTSFDPSAKACDRGKAFWHVSPKTLMEEQTFAISQILAYRNSVAYISEEVLREMVSHAVNEFSTYTNSHLFKELRCQKRDKVYPRVEAIVVFDGAWSQEYTADFLSAMLDELDVSVFGSKIGLIHGSTGEWLLKVTNSPARAHHVFANFHNLTWPSQINFERVLRQTFAYLNATWKEKHENHIVGNLGQVIVFLAPRMRFETTEQQATLKLIKELKAQHPDVHFLYYVSDSNAPLYRPFLLSQGDDLIRSSSISDITRSLLRVFRVLRPGPCNTNVTAGIRDQVEEYVSPHHSIVYRLHPHWRRNTRKVTVTVHNVAYGTIEVCSWNQQKDNVRKEGLYCRELVGHAETTLVDYAVCNDNAPCNTTYYKIAGFSSRSQCAEIDCQSPDYIRYIIRVENLYCSRAAYYSPEVAHIIFAFAFAIISYRQYY